MRATAMIQIALQSTVPRAIDFAQRELQQGIAEVLQEVGVQVLSLSRLDFEVKSRRGTGAGGIRWAELSPKTEEKKARRGRKPGKTKKGTKRKRDAITGAATGQSQIGVDTGMLRNSSQPGFQGPDGKGGNVLRLEAGSSPSVTVGYNRTYAGYFDGGTEHSPARPLLPDPVPPEWLAEVDAIVNAWLDEIARPIGQ